MMRSVLLATVLLGGLAGCAYYEVRDPDTGKLYYTTNWDKDRYKRAGHVDFKDAKSGARVVLDSSEVRSIPPAEYHAAVGR